MRHSRPGAAFLPEGDITCRQQVGGSAIEASKISGHSNLARQVIEHMAQRSGQPELSATIQSTPERPQTGWYCAATELSIISGINPDMSQANWPDQSPNRRSGGRSESNFAQGPSTLPEMNVAGRSLFGTA